MASPRKAAPARGWLRKLFIASVVSACLFTLLLAVHVLRLDWIVRDRFADVQWALPAQIYAAPSELYAGRRIDRSQLVDRLQQLGYRQRSNAASTGSFAFDGRDLLVASRGFQFWDAAEPARRLRLRFGDGGIRSINLADDGSTVAIARLDPLLIGSIFPKQGEDRVLVRLEDVPPLLIETLLDIEDRKFRSHWGVDPVAIARAAWANLRARQVVQGGSTITQQLIKNMFLTSEQTLLRKANEAIMALLLELHASKDAILEAYLNEIYLGQDGPRAVHGFGLASQFYFNKPLAELDPGDIALLVGMIRGPSYYNPRRSTQRATDRRDFVLDRMAAAGLVSPARAAAGKAEPLNIRDRAGRGSTQFPAFTDLIRRQLRNQYRDEDLTSEGLRIFTSFDPTVQAHAERALARGIEQLENAREFEAGSLQGAVIVTTVDSGEVLAVVGGRQAGSSGFNRALDARRPIGSLGKPMVYLAALERPRQFNLVTPIDDAPVRIELPNGDIWEPENYDKQTHGPTPLYQALSKSYNLATVHLSEQLGPARVAETHVALGGTRPRALHSLALGAVERSPFEVAQLYNTLAAGGAVTPLQAIRAVQTRDGEPLQRYGIKLRQAADPTAVNLLQWALRQVMIDGTGRSAQRQIGSLALAGKTGTTDDLRDSWFAGFGSDLQATVWLGRDDNKPAGLTGASGALQIWAQLMRRLQPQPVPLFAAPGTKAEWIDSASGLRADHNCPDRVLVPFVDGTAPQAMAPCARGTPADDDQPRSFWDRLFGG